MILHNMFVAVRPSADSSAGVEGGLEGSGGEEVRRSQTGGAPGRGPLIVPLSLTITSPFVFAACPSHPASQLRGGGAWPPL